MSTPFSAFQNSTITFKVRNGEPVRSEFGHLVADLVDYPIQCYLKQSRKVAVSAFEGAANQTDIYVEGRCIDPQYLPADLQADVLADAVVDGVAYKFQLKPSVASPFYSENDVLGQRVEGFLSRTAIAGGQA